MEDLSTVHTGITVTQEDVLPAQNLDANRNVSVCLQPNHTWHVDTGINFLPGVLLDDGSILADQCESASARTNTDRLK
jgi:hypothetical protein